MTNEENNKDKNDIKDKKYDITTDDVKVDDVYDKRRQIHTREQNWR